MNLLTWCAAYCLFPRRTLVQQQSQLLECQVRSPRVQRAVEKYEARGWRFSEWENLVYDDELTQARRVGDRWTWVVPFDKPKSSLILEKFLEEYDKHAYDLIDFSEVMPRNDEVTRVRFSLGCFSVVLLKSLG